MFGWCMIGQHDKCEREFERYQIDPKTNKVIWLGEIRTCECTKRGCKCYVPKKDRAKKVTKRRKR